MVNAGVEPNVHTYGALIDGCARAGQVAKAFGAYGILRSKVRLWKHYLFSSIVDLSLLGCYFSTVLLRMMWWHVLVYLSL